MKKVKREVRGGRRYTTHNGAMVQPAAATGQRAERRTQ